jgi:aspartate carbamoyltransferase catalytic subunit
VKHLLSVDDLSIDEIHQLFETAADMHDVQRREVKKLPALRGRTVVNMFFEDSTRTRSSFEIAGKWLSADTINIAAKGSSASKGESLRDTVLTVCAMGVDGLVIRHPASGAAHQVSRWVDAVLPEADAVIMLRVQRERMSGAFFPSALEYTVGYGLTRNRLALLKPDVPICHPGPMNRGLEIAADAADAAQSVVLEQVSSGLAIRMAVLYHLLAGETDGGVA